MKTVNNAQPQSYEEAEAFLDGRDSRKICYETYIKRRGEDCIAVQHHDTDIVEFYRRGSIYIDHGGYETKTTKERLTMFTPITIDGSTESGWTGARPKNFREWEVVFPGGVREEFRRGLNIGEMLKRQREPKLIPDHHA